MVVAVFAFGAGWWASNVVGSTAQESPQASEPVLAEVVEASVGRSVTYTATLRQPFRPIAVNALSGVVTGTAAEGDPLEAGANLYVVGQTPVRVVEGDQPFWRPLQAGVKGVDVRQLQALLIDLGYLEPGLDDGTFGGQTTAAVRQWQADSGVDGTGSLGMGELIAVPRLPQALALGEEIYVGAQLAAGTGAVSARIGTVEAELVLGPDQARLIPSDAAIELTYDGQTWPVVVASQGTDDSGQTVFGLTADDGGAVCGEDCDSLPATEELAVSAVVELSPAVTGPAVPVTAVRTDGSGTYVIVEDGTRTPVTVVGSSGGLAVVEGVETGARVVLGEETPSTNGTSDGTDG